MQNIFVQYLWAPQWKLLRSVNYLLLTAKWWDHALYLGPFNSFHQMQLFSFQCLSSQGKELTRISVTDSTHQVVYDTLVKPENRIIDYLTRWVCKQQKIHAIKCQLTWLRSIWMCTVSATYVHILLSFRYSGITQNDLCNITTTLKDVQEKLKEIIPPDAILVGHSLDFDFASLHVSVLLSLVSKPIFPLPSFCFHWCGNIFSFFIIKSLTLRWFMEMAVAWDLSQVWSIWRRNIWSKFLCNFCL